MGYSLSWLAVEASLEQTVVDHFGLTATGETSDLADFTVSTARLPGWFLMVWDHEDLLVDSALLKELSIKGRLLAVFVEEHVMYCSAEEWKNGARVWGAVHSSDVDLYHIGVAGELPASYALIQKEELDRQDSEGGKNAGVDLIFEIPIRLAEEVVGYRHDSGDQEFHEVSVARPPLNRPKQLPIDGVSATGGGIDKKASRWYQEKKAADPSKAGFFGRLFGKH